MSIQYTAVESTDLDQHLTDVQAMLNEGFQRVGGHVTTESGTRVYTTFLQRGSSENSVNKASVIENQERRIKRVERLIKQIRSLMEGSVDDEIVPTQWAENHMDMLKITGKTRRAVIVDDEIEREMIAQQILKDGGE